MQATMCKFASQVRKLNIVTHLRSKSQLHQLERLKANSATVCTNGSSFWLAGIVVCDRALDQNAKRHAPNTTVQDPVL